MNKEEAIRVIDSYSFRPLTGILFFNGTTPQSIMQREEVFVSVPLRGFCFSTIAVFTPFFVGAFFVSVPLRGFCFSTNVAEQMSETEDGSYRPLTGILFFNRSGIGRASTRFSMFPSPYGDFVFQRLKEKERR